jgi:glucose-1-phosphate adenylyltransferase
MKDMHGLIFAYDTASRMRELTEHRTVSSIPFGGRYRVIDFMLSNMVNADIIDIGVVMRESYQSLLDHLGSGKDWDLARKRGGLRLLPPFGYAGVREGSYRGKMEALKHISNYIQNSIKQQHVVLADGSLIANLPLEEIYEHHLKNNHDITCVCSPVPVGLVEDETFLVERNGRVNQVIIGRKELRSVEYLGVTIISREMLASLVSHCAALNLHDFERDVLQAMVEKLHIGTYIFGGHAAKLKSIAGFFGESMNLLKLAVRSDLFVKSRPIKTKVRDEASTYYGAGAKIKNCIVADGCQIEGEAENCVIFRGVRIEKGAVVRNSVIMQDTKIGKNAVINYVISDKDVIITEGRTLTGHLNYPVAISKSSVV